MIAIKIRKKIRKKNSEIEDNLRDDCEYSGIIDALPKLNEPLYITIDGVLFHTEPLKIINGEKLKSKNVDYIWNQEVQ